MEIAHCVREIKGMDISSKMIALAKQRAGAHGIENVVFSQATLFDPRCLPESYDVILAFNILHLLEDTPGILQRLHALLKPGGLLLSATACGGEKTFTNFIQTLLLWPLMKMGVIPYIRFFTAPEFEKRHRTEPVSDPQGSDPEAWFHRILCRRPEDVAAPHRESLRQLAVRIPCRAGLRRGFLYGGSAPSGSSECNRATRSAGLFPTLVNRKRGPNGSDPPVSKRNAAG